MGAAAWVQQVDCGEVKGQAVQCVASSATLVEIMAGLLLLLQWALKERLEWLCIKTDCSVFVQGLNDPESAPLVIRSALYLLYMISVSFVLACVKVIKVSRLVVQSAQDRVLEKLDLHQICSNENRKESKQIESLIRICSTKSNL